jgi:hypothetical protein
MTTWKETEREHTAACRLCTDALADPPAPDSGTCTVLIGDDEPLARCPHPQTPDMPGGVCIRHGVAIASSLLRYRAANN